MLVRGAQRTVRNWIMDSRQWDRYEPRPGDVVVATAPKVGTTWTQRIVRSSADLSVATDPRPDHRDFSLGSRLRRFQIPIEGVVAILSAQTHRRAVKSHLPFDALPLYDEVRYIHTARGGPGRHSFSFHNHYAGLLARILRECGPHRP